jgi:hypothetical protein
MIIDWFDSEYHVDESPGFHGAPERGVVFLAENELSSRVPVFDEFDFFPLEGASWTGRFQRAVDNHEPKYVFSTPVPSLALIVAGRQGYVTDVVRQTARCLPSPVLQTDICKPLSLLVMVDFYSVTLLSSHGVLWRSPHLVTDDLKIVSVEADCLTVQGFVAGDHKVARFRLSNEPLGLSLLEWFTR